MILFKLNLFLAMVLAFSLTFYAPASFSDDYDYPKQIIKMVENYQSMPNKEQAIRDATQLLNSLEMPVPQQLLILKTIAKLNYSLGNLEKALETSQQIQTLASEHHLEGYQAEAYKSIGVFHYLKGEHPQALIAYDLSLAIYKKLNDQLQLANLYNNLGLVNAAMGDIRQALINYQNAETLYRELGSEVDKVDIRYNIAGLYLRLDRFELAIEMFKDVIEKRIELLDNEGLANVYSDIGVAYKYIGQHDLALKYLQDSLEYFKNKEDHYNLASLFHNISEVYNELGQPKQAIIFADQAVEISKQRGYKTAYAGSLYTLAEAVFQLGYIDEAIDYLSLSTEISLESGYRQQLNDNLALRALIYASQNQVAKSLATFREYNLEINKFSSEQLNVELARFESEQLKQQVAQLEQHKHLKQLEVEQEQAYRRFIIVAVILSLLIVIFSYRRIIDRRSKQKLFNKVKQRTQELQQANAVKSQFLANMSHEIRTPLTAVIGQAEAIIYGEVEERDIYKEVGIIHSNGIYLLDLINNILDLTKIEANKLELEIVTQDLHEILHDLANIFSEQARSKELTFEITHTLPSPMVLKLDVFRVKQILINLCSNAIKFTDKGKVILNVSANRDALFFKVSDTGIGMSETQLQHVFESFTQGDNSISRRFGGSGLGLCLSDQLAKLMNGVIKVKSVLNQGSVFSLILPCEHAAPSRRSEVKLTSPDLAATSLTKALTGKILLADDHQDNLRLIARLLASLGLEVFTACNGQEAINVCLAQQPQLILLDIQMPEMDGVEALKILRQKGCNQPIIALTANAMSHDVEKYLSLGFDGHLKKPLDRKHFINVVAKYYIDDIDEDEAEQNLDNIDMSDLVTKFKSNLILEQEDVILHIKNNDIGKLSQLAHRIAGAAQMFGFSELSARCVSLEQDIKTNNAALIHERTQQLLNEIDSILW